MRKGVIDFEGNVVNVIEIADGAEWTPPDGYALTDLEVEKGDRLENGEVIKAPSPERPPAKPAEPTFSEVIVEALKGAGIVVDLDAAKQRLTAKSG